MNDNNIGIRNNGDLLTINKWIDLPLETQPINSIGNGFELVGFSIDAVFSKSLNKQLLINAPVTAIRRSGETIMNKSVHCMFYANTLATNFRHETLLVMLDCENNNMIIRGKENSDIAAVRVSFHIKNTDKDKSIYKMPVLLATISNDTEYILSPLLDKDRSLKITTIYLRDNKTVELSTPIIVPYKSGDINIKESIKIPDEDKTVDLVGMVNFDEGYFTLYEGRGRHMIDSVRIETSPLTALSEGEANDVSKK